jgi:solute carrier family 25 (mitochondrial oxoglutarate transporter), member 11
MISLQTRRQISIGTSQSTLRQVRSIVANEGASALYSGLTAALSRQVVYTTIRLGLYETIRDRVSDSTTLSARLGSGLVAGGIASLCATPLETSMVRMYQDGSLPEAQRRSYRNVFDAIVRTAREEGVLTLWRGAGATVTRAMIVSSVQLGVYDQAKDVWSATAGLNGVGLHLASSVTSGVCYSVASLPIDQAKSRIQVQPSRATDVALEYTSVPQTIAKVVRSEGFAALWKGLGPYAMRCSGHTVAMLLALEQLRLIF